MTKEVLNVWTPQNLAEMRDALTELENMARSEGHDPTTVYPNKLRVTLVRERLTDGSHVLNMFFFDGERV